MTYKDFKIKTKLLLGFCIILALCVGLSVFAIFTLRSSGESYNDLLDYPQQRLKYILQVETNVMDIRRITTAINAYVGNVERQEGYKTESANVVASVNAASDLYIELAKSDKSLTQAESELIISKAESLKTVLAQYKAELIDPNIESAIVNDKDSVVANAAKNAPLITSLSTTIKELTQMEQELTEKLSVGVMARERSYQSTFTLITLAIVAMSLITAFVISDSITKPIKAMAGYLSQIDKTGNLIFPEEEWEKARVMAVGKNEIAQSLSAFLKMLQQFIRYGECLETIADQDLTGAVEILGQDDTCGVALHRMQETLNNIFNRINAVSSQVASGSLQIAQVSQTLASGASQQAATISVFSETVSAVQAAAENNSQTAAAALADVNEAGRLMDQCTQAMDQMLAAMKEIDQKSKSISSVIKVIDDIAFQTNLLALNAAVEAAHAGQHGKGFSVVAEEVRSLAISSTEAAKETAALIEQSGRSVSEGNAIVKKVSESLQDVAVIATKNVTSITAMNDASIRQSNSMREMVDSITQLSTVVQANSATAQQAAASSQEMSSQAAVLEGIVREFKLGDSSANYDLFASRPTEYLPAAEH